MKHSLSKAGIILLFAFMLIYPKAVFNGASEGLLLWFQIILPTLFPFIMITNLLLYTDSIHYISRLFGRLLSGIFKVSKNGSFAVIAGFLCGYPMGAKVAGDLIKGEYITEDEGKYLLSFCNNTSPVFIMNFIIWKTLDREELLIPSILILLGTPMLLSLIFRRFYLKGKKCFQNQRRETRNERKWNFQVVDDCIMDGFETITKVGGYIILFSVILSLFQSFSLKPLLLQIMLPSLEVTNGIAIIGKSGIDFGLMYPAIIGLTSFGGFCAAAQTQCMIQKTNISIFPYIIEKLVTAAVASLIAFLYLYII
ncbi:transporter [Clostridium sp. C105KSO13]|uniref:transporter n=1 Tax=Clostridium sp. C105KSO13 TaxID=1776045 RepID=UPI0007405898|nr:transporter [Clostridium sp. C105KSO13]CUX44088.1 Sporulation integral membrane protein YlbJ [Clostridium sp. C105KSO13]